MKKKMMAAVLLSLAVLVGSVSFSLDLLSPAQKEGQASVPSVAPVIAADPPEKQSEKPVQEQALQEKQSQIEAAKTQEKSAALPQDQPNSTSTSEKPENESPKPASSRSQGSLKVTGTADFTDSVNKALALLKDKAPAYARKVTAYLTEIRESDHSGVVVQTGVFHLGRNTVNGQDTYWLASVIVHDAYHAELYRQGQEYSGKIGEARCIEVQKEALLEMGAPDSYQTHLNQILQSNYWDVPFEQRNW